MGEAYTRDQQVRVAKTITDKNLKSSRMLFAPNTFSQTKSHLPLHVVSPNNCPVAGADRFTLSNVFASQNLLGTGKRMRIIKTVLEHVYVYIFASSLVYRKLACRVREVKGFYMLF